MRDGPGGALGGPWGGTVAAVAVLSYLLEMQETYKGKLYVH